MCIRDSSNSGSYCANFYKNKIVFSQFESSVNSQTATLKSTIEANLNNFDSSKHYIHGAFCQINNGPNPHIISLASDNVLRISTSTAYKQESKQTTSGNNILSEMQGMYS